MILNNSSLFDLYVVTPIDPKSEVFAENTIAGASLANRGWIRLSADLKAAQKWARRIHQAGGGAYVVPTEYRNPRVTLTDAAQTAELARLRLVQSGRRLAPFSDSGDGILWWRFLSDDEEALERDAYPGHEIIAIDKLDGHVRTEEEFQEWLALSIPVE